MKRLIVCCDGTWLSASQGRNVTPSNPARMSQGLAKTFRDNNGTHEQIVFYKAGVGNHPGWMGHLTAGITGSGLAEDVCEIYHFLATNYERGDEIFFFGFSRGAFTVRAAAGLVCRVGICETHMLHRVWELYAVYRTMGPNDRIEDTDWYQGPSNDDGKKFLKLTVGKRSVKIPKGSGRDFFTEGYAETVNIKVVGVWDTVGALGTPQNTLLDVSQWNKEHEFHDTRLNVPGVWKGTVENAFHALSLDEYRPSFAPVLWRLENGSRPTTLIQCWFPGVHGSIGGGSENNGKYETGNRDPMADVTFAWMMDRCMPYLAFSPEAWSIGLGNYYDKTTNMAKKELMKDPSKLLATGWSLRMGVERWLSFFWNFGGKADRSPGAYYLADFDFQHDKRTFVTNECVHGTVPYVMKTFNVGMRALDGFQRVPNTLGPDKGHWWIKKYTPQTHPHWLGWIGAGLAYPFKATWRFLTRQQQETLTVYACLPEFVTLKETDVADTEHGNNVGFAQAGMTQERVLAAHSMSAGFYAVPQDYENPNHKSWDELLDDKLGDYDNANSTLINEMTINRKSWPEILARYFPRALYTSRAWGAEVEEEEEEDDDS